MQMRKKQSFVGVFKTFNCSIIDLKLEYLLYNVFGQQNRSICLLYG